MKANTFLFIAALIMVQLFHAISYAQVGGQIPLGPNLVPQFVDPLPHFAGLRVDATSGGDLYIKMVPHQQVAVSTGTILNNGTVGTTPGAGLGNYWVYSVSRDGVTYTPPLWPSFTIEAMRGNPLNVTYINELGGQSYEDVNLVLDQSLHWADPLMQHMDPGVMMTPYEGPVPAVVHLHGGEVPSESDGGPDAWFTPGYSIVGPSWGDGGTDGEYFYPNTQEAATLWYHDHVLGATRLNVYAGLAGFYFLRGGAEEDALQLPGWSGDNMVQEVAPAGTSGTFSPEPYLPEIEIVIQDRMFDQNGELYFPNLPPNPMEHPFWTPEFVGNIITVNGKTWPYLSVAPRKYRFHILNGSNARFYELWLQNLATGIKGPSITQVGTDGGFLDNPVTIDPNLGGKLVLGPGERADVVIDFSAYSGNSIVVRNSGRTPYPNGSPPNGSTLGRIMQFNVNGTMTGPDNSLVPAVLRPSPGLVKLTNFAGTVNTTPDKTRKLVLVELMGMGGPLGMLVNNTNWDANGMETPGLGETELPVEGTTEVWQIANLTADAHPMHLHLVQFQLVSRQKLNTNQYNVAYNSAFPGGAFIGGYGPPKAYDFYYNASGNSGWLGGNPDFGPFLLGPVKPAQPNEKGWKDTFIMYPGEVTTVIIRFAPTDLPLNSDPEDLVYDFDPAEGPGYVWHCHIIDHEDNEMMRPYRVISSPYRSEPSAPLTVSPLNGTADKGVVLEQNRPNPVVEATNIRFSLQEATRVKLALLSPAGEELYTILNTDVPAGIHSVRLDVSGLANGIYLYRLEAGSFSQTKKLVVVK